MRPIKFKFSKGYGDPDAIDHPLFCLDYYRIGNSKYGGISVRPVWQKPVTDVRDDPKIEFYGDYFTSGEYILHGFCARAQFDWYEKEPDRDAYAIHVGYNSEDAMDVLDIDKALGKINFMKSVSSRLDKLQGELGRQEDFAELVLRLAKVMGITRFVLRVDSNYPYRYREIPMVELHKVIRNIIAENNSGV